MWKRSNNGFHSWWWEGSESSGARSQEGRGVSHCWEQEDEDGGGGEEKGNTVFLHPLHTKVTVDGHQRHGGVSFAHKEDRISSNDIYEILSN